MTKYQSHLQTNKPKRSSVSIEICSTCTASLQFAVDTYTLLHHAHTHVLSTVSRLDYQQALELEPGNLLARVNLALLLQAEGRFQKAWNELTRVLQTDQWCVPAREARAVISLQMNNLFGALLDINAAIQVR